MVVNFFRPILRINLNLSFWPPVTLGLMSYHVLCLIRSYVLRSYVNRSYVIRLNVIRSYEANRLILLFIPLFLVRSLHLRWWEKEIIETFSIKRIGNNQYLYGLSKPNNQPRLCQFCQKAIIGVKIDHITLINKKKEY